MVTPTGRVVFGAMFEVRLTTPHPSVAVGGVQVITAEQSPAAAGTEKSPGSPTIVGPVVSVTVTWKLALTTFPPTSVTV